MLAMPLALITLVPPLPLPLLMLGALLLAMSIVVGNTFWSTMEQQHVPEDVLGRVDSVAWTGSILIAPVAFAVAGPLAGRVGVRETLLCAAEIGVACNVGALLSRSVRELERLEGDVTLTSPAPSPDADREPEPAPVSRAP